MSLATCLTTILFIALANILNMVMHRLICLQQENMENLSLDAFLVVYSITDRSSFDLAVEVLKQLREEVGAYKAIILVGNKSDLVRKRTLSADEGRAAADGYDCKYIETSAALNHRVDELLVGIHKQIMLKFQSVSSEDQNNHVAKLKTRKSSFKKTKRFLEKIFLGSSGKDKKTENLYVD
ncbi:RAD-like protein [Mya arenaria]|uniref:RAD-like protein n=1 Tax=Mya arenaria TaxID=6604 RepID=A0ABY7EXW5_MYAAR|nr:RAD-like protein [Mya arenaria]